MTMRKLYLGSVSSLCFEEEDNNNNVNSGGSSNVFDDETLARNSSSHFLDGHEEELHGHELQELLTLRLEEQVEFLIRVSYSDQPSSTMLGLHSTLRNVTRDILRMAEDEPYGVRGATIFLRMKNCKGEDKYLGSIAVDTSMVSTFNLTLVLEEGRNFGVALKNWLGHFFSHGKQAHLISPQYMLKKEKLYRSDSGITLTHFHM